MECIFHMKWLITMIIFKTPNQQCHPFFQNSREALLIPGVGHRADVRKILDQILQTFSIDGILAKESRP